MSEQKTCKKCGKPISKSNVVCMYCGHSIKTNVDYSNVVDQINENEKKGNLAIGRTIAIIVLIMNIITIALSANSPSLRYVCMLTALVCGVVAFVLVIMSFNVSKKSTPEEVASTTNAIMKGAIGVLIFSGADFFIAVSSKLFSPF